MSVNREQYESVINRLVSAQTSKVIKREKGERIMKCLKGDTSEGPNMRYNSPKFRFYVKKRGFEVFKTEIPGIGVEEHLFQKVNENGESISYRRVAFMEEFYDILKQFHNHDTDSESKTNSMVTKRHCWRMIKERYTLFPRNCVEIFCNLCTTCNESRTEFSKQKYPRIQLPEKIEESFNSDGNSGSDMDTENDNTETEPNSQLPVSVNTPVPFTSPKPVRKKRKIKTEYVNPSSSITDIIVYENETIAPKTATPQAKSFMEICQLEIIEMDDMDQNYLYVGHFIDVYTNYHILFPLVNKSTAAIIQGLGITVFSYFGIPKTLQSTLGPSFLTPVIEKIHSDWPNRGNCTLANKSAANMLMYCTESEVKDIFKMLASENMVNDRHIPWVKWIPLVQYRLNTQVQELSEPTSYQKVVKQLPRSISICNIHTERGISQVNSPPEILETVVNVPLSSIGKDTSHTSIDACDIVEMASNDIAETEIAVVTEG